VDDRFYRFEVPAHAQSVRLARRLTRARLTDWAIAGDALDDVTLVVSELVTNAVLHATGDRIVCELRDGTERLRITVRDSGDSGSRSARAHGPEDERGRGLLLVTTVSSCWGSDDAGAGLAVWAELPRGADLGR
jgi:anti-sigma regulatory factor (Ser/Thr protein kinase)